MNRFSPRLSRRQMQGLSLIEILISLVIGLVVVGAVMVSYIGSGQSNLRQLAYAEMNENAQLAFSVLSRDLQLAGYSQPTQPQTVGGVTTFQRTFAGNPVLGCDFGFVAPNTVGAVACKAAPGMPSIEISYEADSTNTIMTAGAGSAPSDCRGSGLSEVFGGPAGVVGYYVTYNRYYLTAGTSGRSELHCVSRLGGLAQPLVDNVEKMKIWYGESTAPGSRQIARYVEAGTVVNWANIISVRVCLQMRSAETVLNAEDVALGSNQFLNCDSASELSTDRFLRRSYTMTTTLRNKMAF